MPEETANFIVELVLTNPDGTVDKVPILDNQIRLLKSVLQGQFPNFLAAAVNATVVELNKLVGVATLAELEVAQLWTKQQSFDIATLVDGVNIPWDLSSEQVAQVTLAGDRTLDNPTNIVAGSTYTLMVIQDGTGTRLLNFGTAYNFGNDGDPVFSTGANKLDILSFIANPAATTLLGAYRLGF